MHSKLYGKKIVKEILPCVEVWVDVEATDPELPADGVSEPLSGGLTRGNAVPLTSSNSTHQQKTREVINQPQGL